VHKTINYFTSPGHVELVAESEEQLMEDYDYIHSLDGGGLLEIIEPSERTTEDPLTSGKDTDDNIYESSIVPADEDDDHDAEVVEKLRAAAETEKTAAIKDDVLPEHVEKEKDKEFLSVSDAEASDIVHTHIPVTTVTYIHIHRTSKPNLNFDSSNHFLPYLLLSVFYSYSQISPV
jgi:hypothetical protein